MRPFSDWERPLYFKRAPFVQKNWRHGISREKKVNSEKVLYRAQRTIGQKVRNATKLIRAQKMRIRHHRCIGRQTNDVWQPKIDRTYIQIFKTIPRLYCERRRTIIRVPDGPTETAE